MAPIQAASSLQAPGPRAARDSSSSCWVEFKGFKDARKGGGTSDATGDAKSPAARKEVPGEVPAPFPGDSGLLNTLSLSHHCWLSVTQLIIMGEQILWRKDR